MITNYEKQYMQALIDIYENGFADGVNERTQKVTKRLPGIVIQVDVEKEFPILKSKFVAAKTAFREILWIWQAQSNNIHQLNAKIWDAWADENGAIGLSYGMQINRPVNIYTDPIHKTPESFRSYKNQAEYILEYLREFPNGRWGVATIWNPSELYGMNLVPCCHTTTWNLDGGRLNCVLDQRSGDMPYGVPFNTAQYAELMILFARDLGVKPGILTHVIADAHIYDNQMDGVEQQIAQYRILEELNDNSSMYKHGYVTYQNVIHHAFGLMDKRTPEDKRQLHTEEDMKNAAEDAFISKPTFRVKESAPISFFDISFEDIVIADYKSICTVDFGKVAI